MELIPGFLQGVTRVLISYPFDYIRTNLQTQNSTNIWTYMNNSKLSIRNAYRGLTLPLITVPIDRSIQFFLFEKLLHKHSIITSSIASSLISSIYSVPINFLSTRIITTHTNFSIDHIRSFFAERDYYKGFRADFTKSFVGAIVYTSIYGGLRKHVRNENHNYFLFGVGSSIGSWCVIYPLDTIRVMKQSSNMSYGSIVKSTPIKKLYIGFSIILIRSVPSAGCGMVVYEQSRKLLL